jgi:hypothetical protein
MKIPQIPYNFYGGHINQLEYESEHIFTLEAQLLHQVDGGHYVDLQKLGPIVTVRFGGVENMGDVKAYFDGFVPQALELHGIGYNREKVSRPAALFVDIGFDRVNGVLTVKCKTLVIDDTYYSWHLIYE